MGSFKAEFDRRGVTIAVVSFAEPAKLLHYQQQHKWPFTMLADPQREVYEAFELKRLSWFEIYSLDTLRLYLKLFRRGMRREDYGKDDIYQGGGDFLLDSAGMIHFGYRSQDPADRPSPARLLKEIDRFRAEK